MTAALAAEGSESSSPQRNRVKIRGFCEQPIPAPRDGYLHAAAPKYSYAALIQTIALAIFHHSLKQAPDVFYLIHHTVKLSKLCLG